MLYAQTAEVVTEATLLLQKYGMTAITAGALVALTYTVFSFITYLREQTKTVKQEIQLIHEFHLKRADAHASKCEEDKMKMMDTVAKIAEDTHTVLKDLELATNKNTDATNRLLYKLEK